MSNQTSHELSPTAVMMQLITGYWLSQAVGSVARLAVADHLADGPGSSAELAQAVGADPSALHRVLRTLASNGSSTRYPRVALG